MEISSLKYLENKIEELREISNNLVVDYDSNEIGLDDEIIKLSQLLDDFIAKYMKYKSSQNK